ncbi:MAG TPA: hypothetical protein PKE21_08840 [Flavobacteriales bacterium]|nr:hypothetical protein [Flavobacteriales bacterium]HMR27568.1 hypothetical protein [Flavobacteriales bacterium]
MRNATLPCCCTLAALALGLHGSAQHDAPIPGPPPDEYVDVTGDGIADLLITSRTIHVSDPQQPGYLGQYKVGVRTLSGTSVLLWSTPSTQRWFTLDSAARLDPTELAARIHFKQLSWTDPDQAIEFWLLERPFGPAITKDQDGWYGTGDHHAGRTMVLRSANGRGTSVAAFSFELPYPYGPVEVKTHDAVRVPNGFGREGDPPPPVPKMKREFDFGHEESGPQVQVPAGLPPDEVVDLNDDGVIDVVIRAREEHGLGGGEPGYFLRGISPQAGTAFLMTNTRWGTWGPFTLEEGAPLTPERLAEGLTSGILRWVSSEKGPVFIEVLRHPHGVENMPLEWSATPFASVGHLVYRTTSYGRVHIGALEVVYTLPGGELGVRSQAWVEEGQVLQVR